MNTFLIGRVKLYAELATKTGVSFVEARNVYARLVLMGLINADAEKAYCDNVAEEAE